MSKKKLTIIISICSVLAITGLVLGLVFGLRSNNTTKPKDPEPHTYYISKDGKKDNDGLTMETPAHISLLNSDSLVPGDVIYVLPGNYQWEIGWKTHERASQGLVMVSSGKVEKRIKVINAAYDENSGYTGSEKKAVLDFSQMAFDGNNRGVQINADFIDWYGIDICGAGDNGMYIGGSYNTVEYCDFYNNRDSGLQLGRSSGGITDINYWPSYNLIKNCTSHNNYDDETYGENADGFAAKLTIGHGNVFDGCIAYRNSDDGWDLYAKSDSGNIGCVFIYNCVAFENGYLEYTQKENHARLNYKTEFNEPNLDSFKTRDGDGNGFKLGGSVMNGDVFLYNCLSFQNRMHGVTDNSNPGYLKIENVTSYDNSAAIDDNKDSETFGQIISTANHDTHSNIDVARQSYSYNTVKNVVSVKSDIAQSLSADAYRGSVMNSLLYAGSKTNVVKGVIDADTKTDTRTATAIDHTSQIDLLSQTMFKKCPVTLNPEDSTYTYAISGLRDTDHTTAERVHDKYRNADHSINMGDLLAIVDDFDFGAVLAEGEKAGSVLNHTKWSDYKHFVDENLLNDINNESFAKLLKAKESLVLDCEMDSVYQNFPVFTSMGGCRITWSTSSSLLTIGNAVGQYLNILVTRPTDADQTATLTATITCGNYNITKEFKLVIKKDEPALGKMVIRVAETDDIYQDGGKIIMDAYSLYEEPLLEVQNAAYYSGVLLSADQYIVESTYEYAPSAKDAYITLHGFTVNHPGVYRITHTVALVSEPSVQQSITYQIYVATASADVDFDGEASVSVYRDGYIISGGLTNVIGSVYSVASETPLTDLTTENIKTYANVVKKEFKATSINFTYSQNNGKGYYVYYALANGEDKITSVLYQAQMQVVNIDNETDFMKVAGGSTLDGENVSQTIYLVTKDLDFSGVSYTPASGKFKGLLNGQGHKISNITISSTSDNTGIFKDVEGASIINIKFDRISITGGQRTAIASRVYGGYFHNIAITNLNIRGNNQRTGGLIGQLFDGTTPTEITQVSLVNPIPKLLATGAVDPEDPEEQFYIYGSGNRVGGLIGYIQTNNPIKNSLQVRIENCYVNSYISCGGSGVSSILGQYDENGQLANAQRAGLEFGVEIINCIAAGVLVDTGTGRIGGMLGYHSGVGPLHIKGCLSIQTEYYKNELVIASQKNQSPTIGGYSTAAETLVEGCAAMMEENNTDYDVTAYSLTDLANAMKYKESHNNNWIDYAEFDVENIWEAVYENADSKVLVAPYLQLKFIETTA